MEYHCNCFSAFQTRRVPGAILVYRTSWRPLPLAWRSCSKTFSQVPPKSLARPWFTQVQVGILGWCSSHDTLLQIRISSRERVIRITRVIPRITRFTRGVCGAGSGEGSSSTNCHDSLRQVRIDTVRAMTKAFTIAVHFIGNFTPGPAGPRLQTRRRRHLSIRRRRGGSVCPSGNG